jgi:hypothetical protein
MARRDAFKPNERITRQSLNRKISAPADVNLSGPRVNKRRGETVITDEEEIYIRVMGTATSPRRYAWQEVYHDKTAGGWKTTNRTGSIDSDPAFELNDATVSTGSRVYTARRSRASGAWTFTQASGGGGSVEIKSGETVLMLLGTYDEYKDCPGVPAKPPTAFTDYCEGTRGTELCVPAYAYAVYQRCGYVWNKVGDTRDFGVWANELNGGSSSAWRRFVIPRWGGDVDPATGLPDPDSDCMGVAFVGSGASALTCSCPSWAADKCARVTFRTIPRPCESGVCGYSDCLDVFELFDDGDSEGPYWDREFSVELDGNFCSISGQFGGGPGAGNVGITYEDRSRSECFWGPDQFDPCDPCAAFGAFRLSIELNAEERANCGIGHLFATISQKAMRDLLCGCVSPTLGDIELCDGCDGGIGLPPLIVIDPESISLECCTEPPGDAISGGTASDVPPDAISGGDADTVPADAYSGGGA